MNVNIGFGNYKPVLRRSCGAGWEIFECEFSTARLHSKYHQRQGPNTPLMYPRIIAKLKFIFHADYNEVKPTGLEILSCESPDSARARDSPALRAASVLPIQLLNCKGYESNSVDRYDFTA